MYCTNCGKENQESAKFCAYCGSKINTAAAPAQQPATAPPAVQLPVPAPPDPALPVGMTKAPDGKIWWSIRDKKREHLNYMDDEKLMMLDEVEPERKPSVLRSLVTEAADWAAISSDDYPYAELPSEMHGDGGGVVTRAMIGGKEYYQVPSTFQYMSAVKEDRKHYSLKLYAEGAPRKFFFTPEQYDFALGFILAHRPGIKRK